jgi:hypothetical protein
MPASVVYTLPVDPTHAVPLPVIVGNGNALTVTTICALGPSHPLTVWLTQYEVLPTVDVDGVGAVELPVPPVDTVYHNRFVPVAVNADEVAFKQYTTGVVTPGAVGRSLTVTAISDLGPSQPLTV